MRHEKESQLMNALFVLLSAIGCSLLILWPIWSKGSLFTGDDLPYHLERIKELTTYLKQGGWSFPAISANSFMRVGYGVNFFYPWVTLLPFAWLAAHVADPTTALFLGMLFYLTIGSLLAYYAMHLFSSSRVMSFAFMVFYSFASYRLIDLFPRFALGEFFGLTFLPLVLIGLYEILYRNTRYWPLFTAGLALLLLSHVLSAFIAFVFIGLTWAVSIWFVNHKQQRTLSLLLAGVMAVLAAAVFVFPFLEQEQYQQFAQPAVRKLAGKPFWKMLLATVQNNDSLGWNHNTYNGGVIMLVALILGLVFFKKLSHSFQVIELLGVLTWLMTTSLFPWQLFQHTVLNVIQFPFRLLLFPTIFGAMIAAYLFTLLFERLPVPRLKWLSLLALIGLCAGLWLVGASGYIHGKKTTPVHFAGNTIMAPGPQDRKVLGMNQYISAQSKKYVVQITNHIAYVDGKRERLVPQANRKHQLVFFVSTTRDNVTVDLPVARYKGTVAQLNHKTVPLQNSKRGTVAVKMNRGLNYVTIGYQTTWLEYLSMIVTGITWLYLGMRLVRLHTENRRQASYLSRLP
ncbi:hypothetical protein IV38_GL000717 [Lactobacillus selangorensis]|uniref:Membrane protein 6-pyruvoyl-tetrahydropterin synthase-related domain-containing protein n=1 Tax=Lactobacillus selangorensis TaxID=81857 RepID=A0A0R2FY20_9LACO|nr:hypothetical protein [Lactobacillus selangorensis]KRN27225.1 hypothetical protein IV38_GL000717 [Lactobacillus selangorensis]KRN29853.1 hypothetical protein IV40_GL000561 [Lactobacillus selangorensis]